MASKWPSEEKNIDSDWILVDLKRAVSIALRASAIINEPSERPIISWFFETIKQTAVK